MEEYSAFNVSLFLLRITGQRMKSKMLSSIATVASCLLIWSQLFLYVLEAIRIREDVELLSTYVTHVIDWTLYSVTVIVYRTNYDGFGEVIESVKDFWPMDRAGEELEREQKKLYRFVSKLLKMMYGMTLTMVASLIVAPLLSTQRTLPLACYDFANIMESPKYEIIFVWQIINTYLLTSFIIGIYGLFYLLMLFCYCQTKMLKKTIEDLSFDDEDADADADEMSTCVEYHSRLLEFFKKINRIYSFIIFYHFYFCAIHYCLPLYLIAVHGAADVSVFLRSLLYISMNLLTCLIECSAVALYTDESKTVARSIYNSDWVGGCRRARTALLVVAQRSQRGSDFTAGGMLKIDMEAFVSMLQISFSYYALMRYLKESGGERSRAI